MNEIDCPNHGTQAPAVCCSSVEETLRSGEAHGFHWWEDDRGIPCALCDDCAEAMENGSERPHSLKVICGACFESIWNMNDQPPRIS